MLKAMAGNFIFIGLEEENIRRLVAKEPIRLQGIMGDKEVIIFYGKDPKDLIRELKSFGLELPNVPNIGIFNA